MWQPPKIWEDGRCFIIGGGPSMPREFGVPENVISDVFSGRKTPEAYSPYLAPIHKEHTIAINMAFRLGTWVDVLFFGDDGFWKSHREEILGFQGLRVSCARNIEPLYRKRVKYLERDKTKVEGISSRSGLVSWNKNSGAASISLAAQFGVKQIILLGFDMRLDEKNNQHWHKFYAGNLKTVGGTFKMHKKGFAAISADAKRLGIEIINASPNSSIEEFTKVSLKDILR